MTLPIFPFVLLVLAIVSSYLPSPEFFGRRMPIWVLMVTGSAITALLAGLLSPVATAVLAFFSLGVYVYSRYQTGWFRELFYAVLLILGHYLIFTDLPGVDRVPIYEDQLIGYSVFPQSLYLKYENSLLGALVFCALSQRIRTLSQLKTVLIKAGKIPFLIAAYFSLGFALWYGENIKINYNILQYFIVNLFFISLVDEVYFRTLVQKRIEQLLGTGEVESIYLAMVVTNILFSISYYMLGVAIEEAVMIFAAGLIYGYAYGVTRSIEASIFTHFLIDALLITCTVYQ